MAQDLHIGQIPELRQFGKNLNQASGALNHLFNQLGNQMNRACGTWQDQQAQRFMEEFQTSRAQVERMSQVMLEFANYIQRYCQKAEEIQNIRM